MVMKLLRIQFLIFQLQYTLAILAYSAEFRTNRKLFQFFGFPIRFFRIYIYGLDGGGVGGSDCVVELLLVVRMQEQYTQTKLFPRLELGACNHV